VKWLNDAELEDLEAVKVTWTGQVKVKNETATDEVIKEQMNVIGEQVRETHSVHKKMKL
jgi:hypothetical protein